MSIMDNARYSNVSYYYRRKAWRVEMVRPALGLETSPGGPVLVGTEEDDEYAYR